jgi:hypothetical protein
LVFCPSPAAFLLRFLVITFMKRLKPFFMLTFTLVNLLIYGLCASAVQAGDKPSPTLAGPLGLNTTPTARMDEGGTISANVSTLDPYLHTTTGIQILDPLYIGVRQTAEISSLRDEADRLYPGIDIKLRLARETQFTPEIALGLQSMIGHKRMAGEYMVFSKRIENFDLSGGIAWGRLGSAAHINNPLKIFGNHFGQRRRLDGDDPNSIDEWFTGEDIGFFGGIEYFTPLDGLSLKADWGADRYIIEQTNSDYDAPAPWALGVNYAPADWINTQISLIGGEKIMAALTLKSPLSRYPKEFPRWLSGEKDKLAMLRPYRTGLSLPQQMEISASADGIILFDTKRNAHTAWGKLNIYDHTSLPQQIGRAARHMANHAGESVEKIMITPVIYGIEGQTVSIMRRDLEQALIHHQGSPEEIWRNARFNENPPADLQTGIERGAYAGGPFRLPWHWRIVQDNQISLSEEDNGVLYRTGIIFETREQIFEHFLYGASVRVDIADNLHRLREYRPTPTFSTRGNIDEFASRTISLDHLYLSYLDNPRKDIFTALTAGYVDEMYGGVSGEVLYRPYGKTFAFGVEGFGGFKRDHREWLNHGIFIDQAAWTGHLSAYYEMPNTDLTFKAKIGRYLAGDVGGTLSIKKRFDNGIELSSFVTATDKADFDVFGSETHLYSGIEVSMPIGQVKYVPRGSRIRTKVKPFGRDTGQQIDNPVSLYDTTEPLSYRHTGQYWNTVLD